MTNDLHDAAATRKPADDAPAPAPAKTYRKRAPGLRRADILKASDIAALCAVDLKTVHNWVDLGRIESFKSPGGHLRFQPPAVVGFLERFGYDVPQELRALAPEVLTSGSRSLTDEQWEAVARWQALPEDVRGHRIEVIADRLDVADPAREVLLALLNALTPKGGA